MRGIYTVGVLDRLLELSIMPDYVIGVSAGACNGLSYVSRQTGRGYRIIMDYIGDARYVSVSNYLKTGSMFGMDFIFDEIPHKLDLYDYDALLASPCGCVVGLTDVRTGQPVYFDKRDMDHDSLLCFVRPPLFRFFLMWWNIRAASIWMAGRRIRFLSERLWQMAVTDWSSF